jgi:hypothetical protein
VLDGEKNSRRRVMSHENIETESNVTSDTSEGHYFSKDKDVVEHHSLYVPIFFP